MSRNVLVKPDYGLSERKLTEKARIMRDPAHPCLPRLSMAEAAGERLEW